MTWKYEWERFFESKYKPAKRTSGYYARREDGSMLGPVGMKRLKQAFGAGYYSGESAVVSFLVTGGKHG